MKKTTLEYGPGNRVRPKIPNKRKLLTEELKEIYDYIKKMKRKHFVPVLIVQWLESENRYRTDVHIMEDQNGRS